MSVGKVIIGVLTLDSTIGQLRVIRDVTSGCQEAVENCIMVYGERAEHEH